MHFSASVDMRLKSIIKSKPIGGFVHDRKLFTRKKHLWLSLVELQRMVAIVTASFIVIPQIMILGDEHYEL